MGNAVKATQQIACGHTDRTYLQRSLLSDRLADPTAQMVEAVLFLQGSTVQLQRFASRFLSSDNHEQVAAGSDAAASRSIQLLSMAYCTLFGYRVERSGGPSVVRGSDPQSPEDFMAAFAGALRRPQELLQDLLAIRAQDLPREKIMRLSPLVRDVQARPESFGGQFGEEVRQLTLFMRGFIDSAEIYVEIRDSVASGHISPDMAAKILDGTDSDQRRMINAMGTVGAHDDQGNAIQANGYNHENGTLLYDAE